MQYVNSYIANCMHAQRTLYATQQFFSRIHILAIAMNIRSQHLTLVDTESEAGIFRLQWHNAKNLMHPYTLSAVVVSDYASSRKTCQ